MLIFDTEHFNVTKVYTLTDRFGGSYTFESVTDAKEFIDWYYRNPVCAMFAYHMVTR